MSVDWIKRNVKVFSKELDLETASRIPGLRAVFGESYPDPVRVVTLEYDVEDISKDLENPKWRKTSVEFCGGTWATFLSFFPQSMALNTRFTDMLPRLEISRTL